MDSDRRLNYETSCHLRNDDYPNTRQPVDPNVVTAVAIAHMMNMPDSGSGFDSGDSGGVSIDQEATPAQAYR